MKKPFIDEGIWRYSRHPNYFADIIMWQGIFLSVLAVSTELYWTGIGHLLNFCLFNFYSVPAMEKHLLKRVPEYSIQQRVVSRLIPWFRSESKAKEL